MLVNNVGTAYITSFEDVSDGEWEEMWQLNVMSYVRAIRAVAAADARARERRDRQRLVDRGQAAVDRDAALLRDEGGRALALAARRGRLREGRHPLQRRDARDRRRPTPGSGRGGLAEQQGDRAEVLAKVAAGATARAARRARGDRRGDRFLCSERASYVTGAAWSADGGTVPIII